MSSIIDSNQIEEGNPDLLDGLINFKKREMIFNVISEIQQYPSLSFNFSLYAIFSYYLLFQRIYQQVPYTHVGVEQMIAYLVELPIIDDTKQMEKELYDLSLQLEPRGAQKSEIVQ